MENTAKHLQVPNRLHFSEENIQNQVKYSRAYPDADCNIDHNLVVTKCELYNKNMSKTKKVIKMYNVKLLKDEMICKECKKQISNK